METKKLQHYVVKLDESKQTEAGRGSYGTVYNSRVNGAKCVVKKIHDILTGAGGQEHVPRSQWSVLVAKFIQEIELLSQQRHPNIVQFLGVCNIDGDPRDICLVMEQLEMDLNRFIESYKSNISKHIKLSILKDVSCGVGHLHANGIVHRDLNAGNVLISTGLQAKVADLGVSRVIESRSMQQYLSRTAPGAVDYMPPEVLGQKNPKFGFTMDSFSFGHLSLYLVIETYPLPKELTVDDLDLRKGRDGRLLRSLQVQKREEWIRKMGEAHPLESMTIRCLDDTAARRPSMIELREQLDDKIKAYGNIPSVSELNLINNKQEETISTLASQIATIKEQIEVFRNETKRIADENLHYKTISSRLKQEKEKFLSVMEKESLEEVQKQMIAYKKRIASMEEQIEVDQKETRRITDENLHYKTISSRLKQEKDNFLSVMEKQIFAYKKEIATIEEQESPTMTSLSSTSNPYFSSDKEKEDQSTNADNEDTPVTDSGTTKNENEDVGKDPDSENQVKKKKVDDGATATGTGSKTNKNRTEDQDDIEGSGDDDKISHKPWFGKWLSKKITLPKLSRYSSYDTELYRAGYPVIL